MEPIMLGQRARDRITGFEGIVTGRCMYLTGCDQYCLTSGVNANGQYHAQWFDVARLEVVSAEAIVLPQEGAGG